MKNKNEKSSKQQWPSLVMIALGLLLIPAVHFLAPFFIPDAPTYVATNESTSIMAKTNVYVQLLPFAVAYLTAPLFLVLGLIRFFKQARK